MTFLMMKYIIIAEIVKKKQINFFVLFVLKIFVMNVIKNVISMNIQLKI